MSRTNARGRRPSAGCVEESSEMSEEDRQAVVAEIHARLDEYAHEVTSKDIEAMLRFWNDSEEFLYAANGRILGSYDEWAALTTQHNAETQKCLYWNWQNVNVGRCRNMLPRRQSNSTTERSRPTETH